MLNLPQNPKWDIARVSHSTLVNADCFDVFPFIDDKSIDAIICDLPYGTTACKWDIILPFDKLWKEYERIIKDSGVILLFGNEPFSSIMRISNLKNYRYDWIWEKERGVNFLFANKQPMKIYEVVSVFYAKQPTYNPIKYMGEKPVNSRGKRGLGNIEKYEALHTTVVRNESEKTNMKYPKNILKFNTISRGLNEHPTQKPVELLEYFIKTYTNENDMVLDNTMGSGTTNLACLKLNRKSIGIEKEKQYYDVAVRRLSSYCG